MRFLSGIRANISVDTNDFKNCELLLEGKFHFAGMSIIKILDREFEPFLRSGVIEKRVTELARQLSSDYKDAEPLFVCVLNGSFIFSADLLRKISIPCQVAFIKVSSYQGTQSTGSITSTMGLTDSLRERHVVILEDIVDTGLTVDHLLKEFEKQKAASIKVCSLLLKPKALKIPFRPEYTGFEVDNRFLVGYGLDYDGYGRNLDGIYCER